MIVAADPLVTIITPTLDQGRFIGNAIRSVANQTYRSIEHIVVDGGSADGTLDILRGFESPRFRWSSGPDAGMYDAINRGLVLATGEVLGYLNSDDAYLPWSVECAVAYLEAHPEIDLVYGDGVRIEEPAGTQHLRLFPPFEPSSLAHLGSLMQPSVFWRRRLYEDIGGFDAGMRYVADLDYWLRSAGAGRIAHVDEVLSVERVHADAMSAAQSVSMADEERRMRRAHGADPETEAGRARLARARRRDKIWTRRLWLGFLVAHLRRRPRGPWARFLGEGAVRVATGRILFGLLPRIGYGRLPDAVRSGLAAELMSGGES